MCAVDDCEPAVLWDESWPTARKPHTCEECGRAVRPGECYRRVRALSRDDGWSTWATCRHCDAAGKWMAVVCGGYPASQLLQELRDHWYDGSRSIGMGRLIVGMRRRWRDGADPVPDPAAVRALAESMMLAAVA